MQFIIDHTKLLWCWWDVAALLILVIAICVFFYKYKKSKDAEDDLTDKIQKIKGEEQKAETSN